MDTDGHRSEGVTKRPGITLRVKSLFRRKSLSISVHLYEGPPTAATRDGLSPPAAVSLLGGVRGGFFPEIHFGGPLWPQSVLHSKGTRGRGGGGEFLLSTFYFLFSTFQISQFPLQPSTTPAPINHQPTKAESRNYQTTDHRPRTILTRSAAVVLTSRSTPAQRRAIQHKKSS